MDLFDKFSLTIVDAMKKLLKDLPKAQEAELEKVWSEFHKLSQSTLPSLWERFLASVNLENSRFFQQAVSVRVFKMLLKETFSTAGDTSRPVEVQLTIDELNTMRYACVFVPHSLLRSWSH